MNNWFNVTAKFTRQNENGTFSRVSEKNLFAAMTFSDAEERVYKELEERVRGEFKVTAIAIEELHDIFAYEGSDNWYKCKISFDSHEGDSEKTKKSAQTFLVEASSVKEATERLLENLSTMMIDFEITGVIKSPIVEVFPYVEVLDKEISRKPLVEGVSPEQL